MRIILFSLTCIILASTTATAFATTLTPSQCPYAGNTNSKIYHSAGQHAYAKMLRLNQNKIDNRKCFKTEQQAKNAGYRASKR